MISEFVREQKRYTQKDLCRILECTEEKAIPLIRKLKEFGVLKAVRVSDIQRDMSDLLDEDIEVADVEAGEDEYYYVFTFVGVIVVAGRVMKCYPKYLLHAEQPKEELRQVIKVLEKYNTKVYLVNTGWTGGPYGVGSRMKLKYTRAMVTAALNGTFDDVEYKHDEVFNVDIPQTCPNVPSEIMNPRDTWEDKAAYDAQAKKLAKMFQDNFTKKYPNMPKNIAEAGPKAD